MSSYNTDSERVLSQRAVEIHRGQSLRTLVGGLGLGYTAFELARNQNVETVEVVEYLPQVIQWLHDGLVPLSAECTPGSVVAAKLQVLQGDIFERLAGPPNDLYDLIVIDVDHSPSDQLGEEDHGFYTARGILQAKRHLRDDGVLAVWSYAESTDFSNALRSAFQHVEVESVRTHNDLVNHEQTDWLFFGFAFARQQRAVEEERKAEEKRRRRGAREAADASFRQQDADSPAEGTEQSCEPSTGETSQMTVHELAKRQEHCRRACSR